MVSLSLPELQALRFLVESIIFWKLKGLLALPNVAYALFWAPKSAYYYTVAEMILSTPHKDATDILKVLYTVERGSRQISPPADQYRRFLWALFSRTDLGLSFLNALTWQSRSLRDSSIDYYIANVAHWNCDLYLFTAGYAVSAESMKRVEEHPMMGNSLKTRSEAMVSLWKWKRFEWEARLEKITERFKKFALEIDSTVAESDLPGLDTRQKLIGHLLMERHNLQRIISIS